MTPSMTASQGAETTSWPTPGTIVLRSRPLRPTADPGSLSRFHDPVWYLGPAQTDDQTCPHSINWSLYPESLRQQFKTFALASLDHRWPPEVASALIDEQPAVLTVHKTVRQLRFFATWLDTRGISQICDVIPHDLDVYKNHLLSLPINALDKVRGLRAVRTLWGYRDLLPMECRLPEQRPWGTARAEDLAGLDIGGDSPFNKTPRVAPATMEALLAWALRVVEDFGTDIRDAFVEGQSLMAGTHPVAIASREAFHGSAFEDRFRWYIAELRDAGRGMPGTERQKRNGGGLGIDHAHVARIIGADSHKVRGRGDLLMRLARENGLEIEGDAYFLGTISGRLDGKPWRDRPFGVREVNRLVRLLTAACCVVICYLSGLRPGEVLQLRRGCLQRDEDDQFVLVGRLGKGPGRGPGPDGAFAERTWAVVGTLATPIAVLESLSDDLLLFPPSRHYRNRSRAQHELSMSTGEMNNNIREFIDWINESFARPGGGPAIPPDPVKAIHLSRFRRTLAYFVVRRPGGLAAAAVQYGHVRSKVTLGYAGEADTSWLEDLAVEELEMLIEQVDDDLQALDDGEHISGPSAQEYRRRVHRAAVFAGRVVNQARNAQRLLTGANHNVHHGEAMTCVWRHETAACRDEHEAAGLEPSRPDQQLCRSGCANLAYTDRDIERQREKLLRWEADALDPLSPQPLRDRASAQATQIKNLIEKHKRTRPGAASEHEEEA